MKIRQTEEFTTLQGSKIEKVVGRRGNALPRSPQTAKFFSQKEQEGEKKPRWGFPISLYKIGNTLRAGV